MKDLVTCALCGRAMKIITHSHLKRWHPNITIQQYIAAGHPTINEALSARRSEAMKGNQFNKGRCGPKHPRWKGGHLNPKTGYKMIWHKGRLTYEHRVIMEAHLGRKLRRDEVIHHIDGNPSNNALDNLQLMAKPLHDKVHTTERHKSEPRFGYSQ